MIVFIEWTSSAEDGEEKYRESEGSCSGVGVLFVGVLLELKEDW